MPTFGNPFEGGTASNLPLAKIDSIRGALICSVAASPGQPRQWQTVPLGARVVLDWGVRFYGGISFSPSVSEIVVLDGHPPPEIPQDGREYQPVIKLPVLIEANGLFMASFTGKISQNRVRSLRQLFELCAEAQRGLLTEYVLQSFDPITLEKGTFYGLMLQPDGWVGRDPDVFGPRLIPPPPPFVGSGSAPAQLPRPNGGGGAAEPVPPAPANDPTPPPKAAPANDPVPPKAAPAAANTGPLARYRPTGRQPY
jgi:hypothetical protein